MNLFDNIINQSKANFLGTQSTQTVPSFMQPQAPRTSSYVAPNVTYTPVVQSQEQVVQQPVQQEDVLKKFLDDKTIDASKKRSALQAMNDNPQDEQKIRDHIQQNYYSNQSVQRIPQGEDLGFFGSIKEGGIGAFRAGEQIPRVIGSGLGYVGEKIGEGLDVITPGLGTGSKELGQRFQQLGSDITMAGMTDGGTNPLTQKQISARQTGGELALTAPIGGGYLAGAKGVGGLALRSGVVGAGFGATQPIIDKGGQATVGDIATGGLVGGVTGAVAGPLIGKVIAPAIGGIASKTGKYGKALVKGGVEGAKKSIVRDVNAVKTGIQKGIQNRADIASTNINRMNAGQIRSFNEEIGVSPGKFLNDRGLNDTGDNLVENLSKNLKLSRKSADEGLANIKGNFKAPTQEIATATVDDTGKFVTKQVDPVETMLRDNLENASSKGMSKESLRAKQLLEKYQEQGLSMTEINEAKRFLNANNKFSYFSDDVSPRKGFVTNLDNEVRKWQFKTAEQQGFTNLKDINKDTKAYYKLLEGIGGWQDKIAGNNPMGLTDWLAFNADPSVFLAKQVAQSNIAKRGYLKGLNALGGRKVQPEVKKPTNLIKNDIPNSNNSGNVPSSKRIDVKKPIVKPNTIKNESKVKPTVSGDTIPEGYFKNAFGEIQKNPSNKKGGFIRNPFAKIEPKRLFAGENSAQPPKGKTGWFKGADGKMRFEIDDSVANILYKDREPYTNDPITTLLDHKELYKQYPELKDVKVTIYSPMSKDADSISANYNSEKNLIMVNRNKIKSPEGLKSTLLHEIQHAIQNKEGFAKGGNMEIFVPEKDFKKLNTELSELISDKNKMSSSELKEAYGTKGVDYYINKIKDELAKFNSEGKYGLYKRLSGEVEARNVQSRIGLTAKERTIKKPISTEDTPRAKQIVRK